MAFTTRLYSYTTFSILSQPPLHVAQQLLDVFTADAEVFGWSLLEATKKVAAVAAVESKPVLDMCIWGKECMACF